MTKSNAWSQSWWSGDRFIESMFVSVRLRPRSDYVRYVRIVRTDRKRKRKKRNEFVQTIAALSVMYATFASSRGVNVGGSATFTTSTVASVTEQPMGRAVSVFTFRSRVFRPTELIFQTVGRRLPVSQESADATPFRACVPCNLPVVCRVDCPWLKMSSAEAFSLFSDELLIEEVRQRPIAVNVSIVKADRRQQIAVNGSIEEYLANPHSSTTPVSASVERVDDDKLILGLKGLGLR